MDEKQEIIDRLTQEKTEIEQRLQEINTQLADLANKTVPTTKLIIEQILAGNYTVTPPAGDGDAMGDYPKVVVDVPAQYLITPRQQRLIKTLIADVESTTPDFVTFNFQ